MKNVYVQKYGGSSVSTIEKIKSVAARIKKSKGTKKNLIVVVSAMGKTTDSLIRLSSQISNSPSKREMDVLLSTGEQVSISLLTMALHEIGVPAVSFTGFQVKVLTDDKPSQAKIKKIDTKKLKNALEKDLVCIVAGFQGVDSKIISLLLVEEARIPRL